MNRAKGPFWYRARVEIRTVTLGFPDLQRSIHRITSWASSSLHSVELNLPAVSYATEAEPGDLHPKGSPSIHHDRAHLLFLDLVRAVAAQLVVAGHASILAFPEYVGRRNFFYIQSYAVVVFLVLSGYVIARSVQRRLAEGTFTFAGYVKDRFARIFVPLLPLFPVVLLGDRVFLGASLRSSFVLVRHDPLTVVSNLFMLQDNRVVALADQWLDTSLLRRSLGSAAPWWSVAVEWWIYLAFGAVVALILRSTKHRLWILLLGLFALAGTVFRMTNEDVLAVAWLVGATFLWLDRTLARLPRYVWWVEGVTAFAILVHSLHKSPGATFSFSVVVSTGVLVFSLYRGINWSFLRVARPPIRFLAGYSYSLYLLHFSMLVWVRSAVPGFAGLPYIVAMIVAANLASVGWWWLIERHYPWVRERLGK